MSYFSAALQRAMEDLSWSQQDLISNTGIHRTSMSGYVRGSIPVGSRTFSRICQSLPEQYRPNLLRGWLLDQIPRKMQSLVEVVPQGGVVMEERPIVIDCPEDVRNGLELLARRSVQAPVRDLILDLARLLSEEGTGK